MDVSLDTNNALEILFITCLLFLLSLGVAFIIHLLWPNGISQNFQAFVLFACSIVILSTAGSTQISQNQKVIGTVALVLMVSTFLFAKRKSHDRHDFIVQSFSVISAKRTLMLQVKVIFLLFGLTYVLLGIFYGVGLRS